MLTDCLAESSFLVFASCFLLRLISTTVIFVAADLDDLGVLGCELGAVRESHAVSIDDDGPTLGVIDDILVLTQSESRHVPVRLLSSAHFRQCLFSSWLLDNLFLVYDLKRGA